MLAGPDATDAILGRGSDAFTRTVCGKLIVNTGTAPPAWSACLAAQVAEAGGRYVEAPVSGSRQQAQERRRSEEHTSELQSLMRISYAVFCLKKKNDTRMNIIQTRTHIPKLYDYSMISCNNTTQH